jgi:hypothetical protein
MKRFFLAIFFVLILLLSSGCYPPVTIWNFPDSEVPFLEQNTYIKVYAPRGWNSFKHNEPVDVAIENISEYEVSYLDASEFNIYRWKDNCWSEIEDDLVREQPYEYTLKSEGRFFERSAVSSFLPIINDPSSDEYVMIVIHANIQNDNSEVATKKVSGYTVVHLRNQE